MKRLCIYAFFLFNCILSNAAVISKIEISAEKSFITSDACNYSEKSVINFAENIVKSRGIYVGNDFKELVLYIDPNLVNLKNSQICIGYLQVEFKYYDQIKIKGTDKVKNGLNIICRRGKTFRFVKDKLQGKIEEIIKLNIDDCLTEIENMSVTKY